MTSTELVATLRNTYMNGPDGRKCLALLAADRIEWLESLFDFSDPEVVLHSAPNDPVTKDAVIVLRSHYETK